MKDSWSWLPPNGFLMGMNHLINEWRYQDVVVFEELVDASYIEADRQRCKELGQDRPSYTAYLVKSISDTLVRHPKMNRLLQRPWLGLGALRWVQLTTSDAAVAVEAEVDGTDIAYARILRNCQDKSVGDIMGELRQVSSEAATTGQVPAELGRLCRLIDRMPAPLSWRISILMRLVRSTRRHPRTWVQHRGGAWAITSPAKYGVERLAARSAWPMQFAFGQVKPQVLPIDGEPQVRRSFALTLAWQRELTTGAVAARFFADVVRRLQTAPW